MNCVTPNRVRLIYNYSIMAVYVTGWYFFEVGKMDAIHSDGTIVEENREDTSTSKRLIGENQTMRTCFH